MRLIFILPLFFILLTGCSDPVEKVKALPQQKQINLLADMEREVLVEALCKVESMDPISFLTIEQASVKTERETVQRATLFSSAITRIVGHKFKGRVENSALVTSFKDFKVSVIYMASNGSEISREEFTIYKTAAAGQSVNFNVEIDRPDQTDSYKYFIFEAESVHYKK